MLKRLGSSSSFASLMGRTSTPSEAPPPVPPIPADLASLSSFSSGLADALESSVVSPPVDSRTEAVNLAKQELIASLESLQILHRSAYEERLQLLAKSQQILTEYTETQETFREHGGFLNAVSILAGLEDSPPPPGTESSSGTPNGEDSRETRAGLRYELVKLVFSILRLIFEGSDESHAEFMETMGFDAVAEAIKLSGLMRDQDSNFLTSTDGTHPDPPTAAERLLSIMYSFLTADFSSPPLFTTLRHQLFQSRTHLNFEEVIAENATNSKPSSKNSSTLSSLSNRETTIVELLNDRLAQSASSGGEYAIFSEIVPLMLQLQSQIDEKQQELRFMVIAALHSLAKAARRSQVALNEVGVIGISLPRLFPHLAKGLGQPSIPCKAAEREVFKQLLLLLLEMGASTKEMHLLFKGVVKGWETPEDDTQETIDDEMLDIILAGVRSSRGPPFIFFDLAPCGYASLNLPSLGRVFPPATHGYTFMAWFEIKTVPSVDDERLVLFGCGDATGKCFLELSITPSLNLNIATSLTKAAVEFNDVSFEVNRLYHIAVVHTRPKYASNSPLSVYINGTLVEIGKVNYPTPPPKEYEVQGWLGTPTERVPAGRLDKGKSKMQWSLGPTWLIHGDLPEEIIFVCCCLGHRYASNFQDQLGQFQTNSSSTALNLRLDSISHLQKSTDKSPLVYAVREKGSAVIPEHRIYFTYSSLNGIPSTTRIDSPSGGHTSGTQGSSRGEMILNSVVVSEEERKKGHAFGLLSGGAFTGKPKGLDVSIWKIGGIAVGLRLVELATTSSQLIRCLSFFVELVNESWRNSEDAERTQAYEILAYHLRRKVSIFSSASHDILFAFAGYDSRIPSQSVVKNSLAFRFLLLDFLIWKDTEGSVQVSYFERLRSFIDQNEHSEFNIRRLMKMNLVRKVLFGLRAHYFCEESIPEVIGFIINLIQSQFGTETIRSIATFLTATLCQVLDVPPEIVPEDETLDVVAASDPSSSFVLDASLIGAGRFQASLLLLRGLHDLLLDPEHASDAEKFAKTITTKWILLLLLDRNTHPYAAVLSLRILVRMLQSQGTPYIVKFSNSTDGFAVMRGALPHLWNIAQIHTSLFALLHGYDITLLPLDTKLVPSTFASSSTATSNMSSEAVRIIIACLGKGARTLSVKQIDQISTLQPLNSAPSANDLEEESVAADSHVLSFTEGFALVLDLLSQANRAVGTGIDLGTTPTALAELVAALRPLTKGLPIHAEAAEDPTLSLPLIGAKSSFSLPFAISTIEEDSQAADQEPMGHNLASIFNVNRDKEISPVSSTSNDAKGELGGSALLLLGFLSQQVTHSIMSRKSKQSISSAFDSAMSTLTGDRAQAVFRATLDAASSVNLQEQVTFRAALISDICRRLENASTMPIVSTRIAAFVKVAVDFSFQGWNPNFSGVLDFSFSYLEKLLDAGAVGGSIANNEPIKALYQSLNRLVLLAVSQGETIASSILDVLVRHQLSLFALQNTDQTFFNILIYRLYYLLQSTASAENLSAIVDFFKLLVLQRPVEIENALGQQRQHDTEAKIVDKLVDTNETEFTSLIKLHGPSIIFLEPHWAAFIKGETQNSRQQLVTELTLLAEISAANKVKKDTQRHRTRKHRSDIYDWSQGLHDVEATRIAHTRQDLGDHLAFIRQEWASREQNLRHQCAIWASQGDLRKWQLDFTEGYCRMRKKLQRLEHKQQDWGPLSKSDGGPSRAIGYSRKDSVTAIPSNLEAASKPVATPVISQEEVMWTDIANEDTPATPTIEVESREELEEDKNRKVRRNLEQGDVIVQVFNVSRISGLDACAGLLILAKKNLYIIDNFFQRTNGELVDAWDAPEEERDQHLRTLADLAKRNAKASVPDFDSTHRSRRWHWADLLEIHQRKYLFRDVALELFFADGRSFLLTLTKSERGTAYGMIASQSPAAAAFGSLNVSGESFGAKVQDAVMGQRSKLEHMTKKWERREMSNFEYLMFLNTCAGRTYNDLTNYPVFPWILADYTSLELDLSNPSSFRDLSKPMGAQNEERKKEFQDRYAQLSELNDGTKPFHYGTHYSSAMIVVGYMVRLAPFTDSYLDLQGGSFDHADRMFWSIPKAWESSSQRSRSDVRELIPEFFYLPEFLRNDAGLDLGSRQETEANINDVDLPPWAHNDPQLFIELHREALESDYVSQNLSFWIDLVFGYRQTGEMAMESVNVFHELSYEGAIDLDSILDSDERKAATSTIHNFGMTPRQLFTKAHPSRLPPLVARATNPLFSPDLLLEQQAITLTQSIMPVLELTDAVHKIYPSTPDKVMANTASSLLVPTDASYSVNWGFADQSVRICKTSNKALICLFENLQSEAVTAACFADAQTLITGSSDTTLAIWRWRWRSTGKDAHFQQLECLRGHSDQISCIAASRSFSIIVSGSVDRTAIIWDLNRRQMVHCLEGHESGVRCIAICRTTGDIATCSEAILRVFTVNGRLLATQSTSSFNDPITAVAFSTSESAPIIVTGHRNGRIMLWRRVPDASDGWKITQIHTLRHKDRLNPRSVPDITSLACTSRTIYSGDSSGKVWLWSPPGTEQFLPDSTAGGACMSCWTKLGMMETRRRCSACAGIFCSLCSTTSIEVGGRFCGPCFSRLSPLMVMA